MFPACSTVVWSVIIALARSPHLPFPLACLLSCKPCLGIIWLVLRYSRRTFMCLLNETFVSPAGLRRHQHLLYRLFPFTRYAINKPCRTKFRRILGVAWPFSLLSWVLPPPVVGEIQHEPRHRYIRILPHPLSTEAEDGIVVLRLLDFSWM